MNCYELEMNSPEREGILISSAWLLSPLTVQFFLLLIVS